MKNAQEAHEAIRPAGDRIRTPERHAARAAPATSGASTSSSGCARSRSQMADARSRAGHAAARRDVDARTSRRCSRRPGRTDEFLGYRRAYVEGADDPTPSRGPRDAPPAARRGRRASRARELRAVGPHHAAAGALHRGQPGEGARGARHRSPVHVRVGDRDDHYERGYVWKKGNALVPVVDRVREDAAARAPLRPPRRLRLHRHDGRGARRDRRAARARPRSGCTPSTSATAPRACASWSPRSTSPQIDMAEVNTVRIGADARRPRDHRAGLAQRRERSSAATTRRRCPPTSRPTSSRSSSPRSCSPRAAAGPRELGTDPETGLTVLVLTGRFGPFVQLGEQERRASKEKPKRASLFATMDARHGHARRARCSCSRCRASSAPTPTATRSPRRTAATARTCKKGTDSRSLETEEQLFTVTLAEAEAIFAQPKQRRGRRAKPPLAELGPHPDSGAPVRVLDGRFGPTSPTAPTNATVPRGMRPRRGRRSRRRSSCSASAPRQRRRAAKKTHGQEGHEEEGAAKKSTATKTRRSRDREEGTRRRRCPRSRRPEARRHDPAAPGRRPRMTEEQPAKPQAPFIPPTPTERRSRPRRGGCSARVVLPALVRAGRLEPRRLDRADRHPRHRRTRLRQLRRCRQPGDDARMRAGLLPRRRSAA